MRSHSAPGTLRVLGVADADYVHTRKWARFLVSRGHRVHLVSFSPVREQPEEGVSVDGWTIPPFHLKRLHVTIGALRHLRRIARQARSNLVHAHFLGAGAWYAALAKTSPLVISVMGGDFAGLLWQPRSRRERVLTRFTLARADLVICWSERLRHIVRPFLRPAVRCEVVVGGVDTGVFRPMEDRALLRGQLGLDEDAFVILSPRILWPLYNIDKIIRALPDVLLAEPRSRLIVLKPRAEAQPEYERYIEDLIDALELREAVLTLPAVAHSDMPRLYAVADCTVSIPDTDGTPMSVMESLACGTPVVVSDLPEYDADLFVDGHTALRVSRMDPKSVASGIVTLASNPRLRAEISARGPLLVRRRADYVSEMRRLETLYFELSGSPR